MDLKHLKVSEKSIKSLNLSPETIVELLRDAGVKFPVDLEYSCSMHSNGEIILQWSTNHSRDLNAI